MKFLQLVFSQVYHSIKRVNLTHSLIHFFSLCTINKRCGSLFPSGKWDSHSLSTILLLF